MALVTAMITFIDAKFFSLLYPRLLVCPARDDEKGSSKLIKGMFFQVLLVSVIFVSTIVFFADWFFTLMGRLFISKTLVFFMCWSLW